MKRHLWSNPKAQWEGFKPVSHWLDLEKALELPLTEQLNGKEDEPITLGDVYLRLKDKKINPESLEHGFLVDKLITEDGENIIVKGASFNRRLLKEILKLRLEGVNPFSTVWYYYDHDSCQNDPQEAYVFFVVYTDKIIRERVMFSDHLSSGFDPSVFDKHTHSDSVWGDEEAWDKATAAYWYRKFYTQTQTGQLMVLRPDSPPLFYYERTVPDTMGALGIIARSLNSISILLWVVVILAILNFYLRWR